MAENDNNKNNFTGKIKGKTKGKIKAKMAAWFTKTFIIFVMKVLPIFLLVCMVHTAFSWIADLVESVKNPADIYEIMGIDNRILSVLLVMLMMAIIWHISKVLMRN